MLGVLAAFAVIACELPWPVSLPIATAAVFGGAGLAERELLRPTLELVIAHHGDALIDGGPIHELQVHWRGPLAFLQWRDATGRRHHRQGLPDNLGAASRRELRLAMAARATAHSPRSMAP